MTETIYFQKTAELRRTKSQLEKELNVKIKITGRRVSIKGPPMDEYEAMQVLEAINFGFPAKKALLIKDPDMIFTIIHIKDFTRRKNLKEVKARVIGRHGKTKNTLENISGCDIIVKDNLIGIICMAESIETVTTALSNLIRGSKQGNVYGYLEKMNRSKREEGLGLRE